MKKLLIKEIRLAASPLSFIFIAAALMTMLPGYPILMSAFFICLGLFYSFLNAREMNDVLYTVMLPVGKHDFVRAKYAFAVLIQLAGLLIGSDCCQNDRPFGKLPIRKQFANERDSSLSCFRSSCFCFV